MTTPLLDKALAKVGVLPAEQQDAIAALVLDELASGERWDQQFGHSQEQLAALADAALAEDARGETRPLDELLQ
ncbi:hypothetical protein HZA57_09220 [Candidatus Poribacteria bacterium]|nr:hypothetical protein [Candidatus Poribacteria bacterium]